MKIYIYNILFVFLVYSPNLCQRSCVSLVLEKHFSIEIQHFRKFKFVRVCSVLGRYLYNVHIVKSLK